MAAARKRSNHSRHPKRVTHPLYGHPVPKVYAYRNKFCVYNPHRRNGQGRSMRETFPKTLEGFNAAVRRRDQLAAKPMFVETATKDEIIRERLWNAGINADDYCEDNPEWYQEQLQTVTAPWAPNPEYPEQEIAVAKWIGIDPAKLKNPRKALHRVGGV